MQMKNPFIYDALVQDSAFCGREKEIETIKQYIGNGRNVLLYSKRRFGKSSLIREIFNNRLDKKHYVTIYADVYDIIRPSDFPKVLSKAVADSLSFDIKEKMLLLKDVFTRISFNGKIGNSGEFEISPVIAEKDFEALMDDVFMSLSRIAERKNMRVAVAIDEFQQISNIKDKKIDALMRKYIQQQKDVAYIFCGSKKHMLSSLFTDYSAPLYEMAAHLELTGIPADEFYIFAAERMNKKLSREVFDYLYNAAGSEPKTVQNICYHLFEMKSGEVSEGDVDGIIARLIREKDGAYRMIFDNFSQNQKAVLKIIASGAEDIFSLAVSSEHGIAKSSLNSAVTALLERDVIYKDEGKYHMSDRLFELWCGR